MRAMHAGPAGSGAVKLRTVATVLALLAAGRAAAAGSPSAPPMTAGQVADRCIEARGGAAAWRRITAFTWVGRLESARAPVPSMQFQLEEKLPDRSRFEITDPSVRSVRVFNGVSGWKVRTGQDGRPEAKPYTAEEVRFARGAAGLEGPLVGYRSRGSTLELQGMEAIDGKQAYRIGIRLATGDAQTVWVDAQTFLESRYDRTAYGEQGAKGTISVRYHGYREVGGLALPSSIEISGAAGAVPDRMLIDKVALNPPLDEREFEVPGAARDAGAGGQAASAR